MDKKRYNRERSSPAWDNARTVLNLTLLIKRMSLNRFLSCGLITASTLLLVNLTALAARSQTYNPGTLPNNNEVTDVLSEKDIPTGQGGFARDYKVNLKSGDQVVVDLTSSDFDTIITLIAEDGSTLGENDDGPDGSTNSLLFTRIDNPGIYTLRVRSFGEATGGSFTLKLTRLCPCDK
jgi:hypothetical protein